MASHDTFFGPFPGYFRSRARKALKGDSSVDLPFVMSRPRDDPRPDELAEFMAGALIAPTSGSAPEPWQIEGVLYRDPKGPPIVGELRVEHFALSPKAPRAEVTGTVLRGLPLAAIRDLALAGLGGVLLARETMAADPRWRVTDQDVERARDAAREAGKPRRGRPGHPDEHYRRIALRYLELLGEGKRNVLVALAAELSIPRETVRDWVRKATERGYLAPGKPGRAEARPGPNLYPKEK